MSARRPVVPDRDQFLADQCKGKDVLDVGCVDHQADPSFPVARLHRRIRASAAECLGVDILEDGVQTLNRHGMTCVAVDACSDDFAAAVGRQRWDVVVAGEIIEHVEEPLRLVRHCASVLRPGGRVLLTTPNPYSLRQVSTHLRGKVTENVDHLCYFFPSGVQELADRSGLRMVSYRGARSPYFHGRRRLAAQAVRTALRLSEETLAYSMIYELAVPHD